MDIEYKGGNCIIITIKKTQIVVDPNIGVIGLNNQAKQATVQLVTQPHFKAASSDEALIIEGPGEYEVDNISIKGMRAQAHTDAKTERPSATIYRIDAGDVSVVVVGHIHPDLSDDQLEAIGVVDVAILPVGGNGYTLDATGAVQVIRKIDPKVVIPTHYADPAIAYPMPQAEIETFIKELGAPQETMSKFKLKAGAIGESLMVCHITRTS